MSICKEDTNPTLDDDYVVVNNVEPVVHNGKSKTMKVKTKVPLKEILLGDNDE